MFQDKSKAGANPITLLNNKQETLKIVIPSSRQIALSLEGAVHQNIILVESRGHF